MQRILALIILVLAAAPASASDVDARCSRFPVASFLADVPYFVRKMNPAPTGSSDSLAFVDKDDAKLTVALRVETSDPEPMVTKTSYIKGLQAKVRAEEAKLRASGADVQIGIYPFDPISWVATIHNAGADAKIQGQMDIRLSNACHLVVRWTGSGIPVLQSHMQEMGSAIDGIRLYAGAKAEPAEFLPDVFAPTGWRALLLNFLIPLGVALGLAWHLKEMLSFPSPSPSVRAGMAAAAAVAVGAMGLSIPSYLGDAEGPRFVDNAACLTVCLIIMALAAATGAVRITLLALSCGVVLGISIAIEAWFGWTPGVVLGYGSGALIAVGSLTAILTWRREARGRVETKPTRVAAAVLPKTKPKRA